MATVLGHCACPVCKFPGTEVRATDKGKPYISCDECGMQLFARQKRAERLLLAMIQQVEAAPPTPPAAEPEPAPKPAPAEEKTIFDWV